MRRRIIVASLVVVIAAVVVSAVAVRQIIFGGAPHVQHNAHVTPVPCPPGGTGPNLELFTLDGQHSTASYSVQFQAAGQTLPGTVTGVTGVVSGDFTLSTGPTRVIRSLQVTVDLRTLDSGSSERDDHVRMDTFETERYPLAVFTARDVAVVADAYQDGQPVGFQLPGELTLHGVTRPVTFQMQGKLMRDTAVGSGTTVIHIGDFGMRNPQITSVVTVTIARDVTFAIDVTAQRKTCPAS